MSDNTIPMEQIETAARQQGWDPDKGDLSALDFLAKGREFRDRLYDKVEKLSTENEKLYKVVSDHITKTQNKERLDHNSDIERQIKEATDAGDSDKVLELTKQIHGQPQDDPTLAVVEDWKGKNKWYTENNDMHDDANGFYQAEMMKIKEDNPVKILPVVEARIKKLYPDYFQPRNPNAGLESGAEKGGTKKPGKSSGLAKEDLTEIERRHFDDFVSAGLDPKKLLRSIERDRANQ